MHVWSCKASTTDRGYTQNLNGMQALKTVMHARWSDGTKDQNTTSAVLGCQWFLHTTPLSKT